MGQSGERLAVIAPTSRAARSAAAFLAGRAGATSAYSLAGYLSSSRAPGRIALCPAGHSVSGDVDFLREAHERLLWHAPEEIVRNAIEGFLGSLNRQSAAPARKSRGAAPALLLEGTVTSARARALLRQEVRLWIVENPRRVRVGRRLLERLGQMGVRWSALEPVSVAAAVVSPRLLRVRSRWKRLLPAGTPLWVMPVSGRKAGLKKRRREPS